MVNNLISKQLENLVKQKKLNIKELLRNDSNRVEKYSTENEGIYFDYSKNRIDDEILTKLIELAKSVNLEQKINQMFKGEKINNTEDRAVLHTALRDFSKDDLIVNAENISKDVKNEKQRIANLVNKVISGEWKGFSGKKITDVVNIGIGGSDLGPKMVVEALRPYHTTGINVHFVSNVDADSLLQSLNKVNPETTLFIIASKSFSTEETLLNSLSARKWLINHYKNENSVANHFVAISSKLDKVEEFGINLEHCYKMWDWVGGRYSLWSSIGMSISFAIGNDNFESF